ncbi:MAG TPA: hypothetical protein VKG79_05310 [Bryobacteraceae bacterium]|nr:hypothetical protein [Bryobacteraceae bacterium]
MLLAGSRDSLLFRSTDGAISWQLLAFPHGSSPGTFNALIVHPRETGHFYAGLDAGNSPDSGLWESKDGGESWRQQAGLRGERIESLAMWARDPQVIAAGTAKGVFLTSDGGGTWQRISRENDREMQDITALAFDPADSKILYAGTPHLPWKTVDAGASWRSIAQGLIDDSDIFSIRVNPAKPELLFASACSGIYRSENGGGSWVKLQGIPGTHRRTHIISEDPAAPDTIYAGTTLGLFKSADTGKTWRHLTSEQVNWMVFDPADPRTLYLASEYAGIQKSADSGETFHAVNAGFANHSLTQITGIGAHVYASSAYEGRFGGVFTSEDGGLHWTLRSNEEALAGRSLNSLAVSPGHVEQVFAASEEGVVKSTDGGKTWTRLLAQPRAVARPGSRVETRLRVHTLRAVQSGKATLLLAGTDAGLFRSLNAGATWEQTKTPGIAGVPVVAIYAPAKGAAKLALETRGGLFISEDAGLNWRGAFLPDASYYLYDLALSPEPDAPMLAATARGVLQSTDGGARWNLVTEGVPASTVESVRYHPDHKLEAFLVQFGRIYHSLDGGTSWELYPSDGLENSSVRRLWFAPDLPGRMLALSAARGVFVFDLPQLDSGARVDANKTEIKNDR